MKFGINVVFKKLRLTRVFFLPAIVDEGVKTTLKVGSAEHIYFVKYLGNY